MTNEEWQEKRLNQRAVTVDDIPPWRLYFKAKMRELVQKR